MALQIHSDQMHVPLRDDQAFAAWYVEHFMRLYLPDYYWSLSEEGRLEMVVNGRRYARYFRIQDTESQMHFVTFMWRIGANFFLFPGFQEVATAQLSGPEKIAGFYDVDRDLAAEAIKNPDDRYWYPEMVGLEEQLS